MRRPTTAALLLLVGLAPIARGEPAAWPVELGAGDAAARLGARVEASVERAGAWMAAFPARDLRFDAAVMLSQIRRTADGDALRRAFAAARAVADRDDDNPLRRFWLPDLASPAAHTSAWAVPDGSGARVNTNRVVGEALHCARNGWRPATTAYACGPMRDGGGYQTTHALWALVLAQQAGCLPPADVTDCERALRRELAGAQPAALAPARTLDIDLYAERLLVLALSGDETAPIDAWGGALLERQAADGSWGVPAAGEAPYARYHTTAMSTWALVERARQLAGRRP